MNTKLLLSITLATIALFSSAMADKLPLEGIQQQKFSKLIIGKWQADKGLVMTFSADGSYAIDSDGPYRIEHSKGRWRIEGNRLIIDFNDGKTNVSQIEYLRDDSFALEGRHHHDVFDRISH